MRPVSRIRVIYIRVFRIWTGRIRCISSSSGRIRLSWGAVAGAYEYVVYRSEDGGQNYRAVRYTANTTYTNQAVTPGVTYYYRVKAKCSRTEYGDSAFSSVVSIRCK